MIGKREVSLPPFVALVIFVFVFKLRGVCVAACRLSPVQVGAAL